MARLFSTGVPRAQYECQLTPMIAISSPTSKPRDGTAGRLAVQSQHYLVAHEQTES